VRPFLWSVAHKTRVAFEKFAGPFAGGGSELIQGILVTARGILIGFEFVSWCTLIRKVVGAIALAPMNSIDDPPYGTIS